MGSNRPADPGRAFLAALTLLIALLLGACARRIPTLVPPSCGLEAVEGYASASISGADAAAKGRFAFVFRRPGFGRVEAVDPIGRTAFLVLFRGDRAWFVLPGKKVYAEDAAPTMMGRFLGIDLLPDEILPLLSGLWTGAGPESGWTVERDERGRAAGAETTGRLKVLELAFNPAPADAPFDVSFLRAYAPKTWDGILEILDR
ncbi:MAG: hypothetical protein H6P96_511 [Candidatus Aminicenantes bacterium]|nr:hypothetical protein [Candidatus Aminicenantes bacterium]